MKDGEYFRQSEKSRIRLHKLFAEFLQCLRKVIVITSERAFFIRNSADFCERHDTKYAATYGRYRLERIRQIGERFTTCGDYLQGVARIRCMTNGVLLRLPHRHFVFTMPKALRPSFRHDRRLFAEVSRLIYDILREFYHEAASRTLLTGMVIAHQTFGDMLRWNPHFHAIVLKGGFDQEGTFCQQR